MHQEVALVQKLQTSREVAARTPNPFPNRVELAAFERKERENAVGFAQLPAAQDHASRLIGARLRQRPPIRPASGRCCRWCKYERKECVVRASCRRATERDRRLRFPRPPWEGDRKAQPCSRRSSRNPRWEVRCLAAR